MDGLPSKLHRNCLTAIGRSHLSAAWSRDRIRHSEACIATSLALLQSQHIYPYHPMPPAHPWGGPETADVPAATGKDAAKLPER